ncbi:hypothetical protein IAQ61_003316 [Plenodomus lingam]|uniref:Heterokaryon incompatibility domain-containing protein n=1 Tax=Leptosphaeria maculans (strain JN3 / isolate v23.1.3 / race Av1-4-5-6-7-8) TaxID=985895 RepID=E5AE48_LEPMJ|nr:hypothetical protein LEMA_P002740.1 [Plenodomus lingam JN3]KAH9875851.1 hypothetical protein IAQ61_003316 [Plenodomus lingam]CBY01487.1 hypothetical protein LEMA_P002740.1 [Plenodomus lingam JN3]
MTDYLPLRLLRQLNGSFAVIDPRYENVEQYDIMSYCWGDLEEQAYDCEIPGVDWKVQIKRSKLNDIKSFMVASGVQYLWVDCICIKQEDEVEKSREIAKMFQYYKTARSCHILLELPEVWDPQAIVDDLKFLDHIILHMGGAAMAADAPSLSANAINRLNNWATATWKFPVQQSIVRSAAVDLGVLNCYSTCIRHVQALFCNKYFTRVWTFQEMILGKNVLMWAVDHERIARIGELATWMDLATDSKDKAYKLFEWILNSRTLNTESINAILGRIIEDKLILDDLLLQVKGISCARIDIINGGPHWWRENHKGISNIFSAVSLTPRECKNKADIFKGLLGIFSDLFTPEEIERDMSDYDIEKTSFNFFKQLSIKTDFAWTKLAISSRERGEWDWIPVVENYSGQMTTDCFAGVVQLGRLKRNGQAKTPAMVGIKGTPRKYMTISLKQKESTDTAFNFRLRGCNYGKKVKTKRLFGSEPIPTNDQSREVLQDETGKILVQCATLLGSLIDPGGGIVSYRQRLLKNLRPYWRPSDPSAKPPKWEDRCVSGTGWENPSLAFLRTHNMSVNYHLTAITNCESRLWNKSTANLICEVRVNCGCTIIAPFAFIFEGITAVQGSSLGNQTAHGDEDDRPIVNDGLGLVQIGDVGKTFNLIAFGGDVNAHSLIASRCRRTKIGKALVTTQSWPTGRALVKEEFTHGILDQMRDYGYVDSGGAGNLLISRDHVVDKYKIIGVCIDEHIMNEKGEQSVNIR